MPAKLAERKRSGTGRSARTHGCPVMLRIEMRRQVGSWTIALIHLPAKEQLPHLTWIANLDSQHSLLCASTVSLSVSA